MVKVQLGWHLSGMDDSEDWLQLMASKRYIQPCLSCLPYRSVLDLPLIFAFSPLEVSFTIQALIDMHLLDDVQQPKLVSLVL